MKIYWKQNLTNEATTARRSLRFSVLWPLNFGVLVWGQLNITGTKKAAQWIGLILRSKKRMNHQNPNL